MLAQSKINIIRCAVAASILTSIPIAVAYSSGADSMLTGGRLSSGTGCNLCHPWQSGIGGVELIGVPQRYRPGRSYDLTVRVFDSEQAGTGFEISAENGGGAAGTLLRTDTTRTDFASGDSRFLTHTRNGVDDSIDNWAGNGGSYGYNVGWQAPGSDVGRVAFFVSGNAINDGTSFSNDHYYWTFSRINYAIPGDADGDTDLDLFDFAALQSCFDAGGATATEQCGYLDMNDDDLIDDLDVDPWTLDMSGPTAPFPAGYALADPVRGGRLYDSWWAEAGLPEPVGDHPLYPPAGVQSGSTTHRCKECHGWDYKGVDGAYGSGSHFTGIAGVFGSTLTPKAMFDVIKLGPGEIASGHDMAALGMSDRDIWDVVRLLQEELVDADDFIDQFGAFTGDAGTGSFGYDLTCINCHEFEGKGINFGTAQDPEYVGTVANENPWEMLHKIRFGHPGSPMPASELIGWTDTLVNHLGAFSQTLPTN